MSGFSTSSTAAAEVKDKIWPELEGMSENDIYIKPSATIMYLTDCQLC